jgi:hypothetical protein
MHKSYRPSGVAVIAAVPETYLAQAYFDDNDVEIVKSNVIAWQVGSDRGMTPLTIDPRTTAGQEWFVIHPDGRVEADDGRAWAGVDAWIADQRRLHREGRRAA